MNFKTIAAAALAVVAASAHANVVVTTGGNSELFFVLGNDKGSFLLDTGLTISALKSASFSGYTQDVSSLAGFSDFVAGSTPKWALAVFDGNGTTGFNQIELVSTRAAGVTPASINNSTLKSAVYNQTGSIALATNTTGTNSSQANGSSFNAVGTTGYFGAAFFNLGQASNQIGNAVGTTSTLLDWKGTTGTALAQATKATLPQVTASFNGTTLSIAGPVPEPSSYAMLAAGLAVLGFVARRRSI